MKISLQSYGHMGDEEHEKGSLITHRSIPIKTVHHRKREIKKAFTYHYRKVVLIRFQSDYAPYQSYKRQNSVSKIRDIPFNNRLIGSAK